MKTCKWLLLFFVFSSCAPSHQVIRETTACAKVAIDPRNPIGVMIAVDARALVMIYTPHGPEVYKHSTVPREERVYLGSGQVVSTKIMSALMSKFNLVSLVETINLADAVQRCRDRGFMYLIVPVIEQWEDRPNHQTYELDKLALRVGVVRVTDAVEIRAFTYRAEGHSIGGSDYPVQRLLEKDFQEALLKEIIN